MRNNNIIIKALGIKYKQLSNYEVVRMFEQVFEDCGSQLSVYQKELLHREWCGEYGRLPFEAYMWVGMENKQPNVIWRLSAIPLVIWMFLLLVFVPIKWIFTGVPYYKADPKKKTISSFTLNWIDKCFNRTK